jgi:leucyl aminopeptidase
MIVLEWTGKGKAGTAPLLYVGKSITFDTGGYSIKPATSMTSMKYDKCGGMAVIGAMYAIAAQKLPVRVVGILPAAENMISEKAYRPDDIITFCNGVTAEITNTDAEGRLVLADALAYGTKTYKPAAVVDLATLTGGVVVALGDLCAGAFVNDPAFHKQLFAAGDHAGEKLWQLPLWDEHREAMKGPHSDIVNSGGRKAHPIQGAAFLSFFVGADAPTKMPTLPWCHLDIAGVADMESDTPLFPKGPTGFGVRLLSRLAATWK